MAALSLFFGRAAVNWRTVCVTQVVVVDGPPQGGSAASMLLGPIYTKRKHANFLATSVLHSYSQQQVPFACVCTSHVPRIQCGLVFKALSSFAC